MTERGSTGKDIKFRLAGETLIAHAANTIHSAGNHEALRRSSRLTELCENLVDPGADIDFEFEAVIHNLLQVIPLSEVHNLKVPDVYSSRNIVGATTLFKAEAGKSSWDEIIKKIDEVNELENFWKSHSSKNQRSTESIQPISLQNGALPDIPDFRDFVVQRSISKEAVVARSLILLEIMERSIEGIYSSEGLFSGDKVALIDVIDEAQLLYAGLTEVIGYDQLSGALFDLSIELRYLLADQWETVRGARESYERIVDIDEVDHNMASVLNGICGTDLAREFVLDAKVGKNRYFWVVGYVDIGSVRDDYRNGSDNFRLTTVKVQARLKGFGAWLEKIMPKINQQGVLPEAMDMYGITLKPANDHDTAKVFVELMDSINERAFYSVENKDGFERREKPESTIRLQAAPSRDHALHVKGPQQFIDSVTNTGQTSSRGSQPLKGHLFHSKPSSNGYNVVKVTCQKRVVRSDKDVWLPTEVQVLSQEVRDLQRTDPNISHWLFKLEKLYNIVFDDAQKSRIGRALKELQNHFV